MTDSTSDGNDREPDNIPTEFERLVGVKTLNKQRLALHRAAWLAEYCALSTADRALFDVEFREKAQEIAAQFDRSKPFVFRGGGIAIPGKGKSE